MDYKKAFILNTNEIKGRIDPLYYIAIQKIQKNIIDKSNYGHIELIEACFIKRGRFGHRPRNDPKFYNGIYPFIQTGDIVKASENNSSIKYTQTLNELGLKTSKLFNPPKLLFTIAANIGDTAILDYSSCFPDSIVALIPKKTKLSIEYLNIYLKFIKPYIVQLAPYATQKNLNNQQLSKIPLIIPPKEIQNKIIQIMDNAYKIKKENEKRAKELLASIDNYLLDKLDITLPKKEKIVSFEVNSSEVFGGRFDPDYKIKIDNLNNLSWKYPLYKLKNLIIGSAQYGANETAQEYKSKDDIRYIRITDINNLGILKKNNMKTAKNTEKQYILNYNDILFARSGSVGRCYIHKNIERQAIFAGYLIRFILNKTKINPDYFFYYCHSSIYKYWVSAIERPTVQSNINSEEFKSLKIPLPPLPIQNEIANHIEELRRESNELKKEAQRVLKDAKDEVERIILK